MSVRVCILSSFFSFPFFLPIPFLNSAASLSPFFRPFFPTIHHGASNHHLSNQIHNIHHLFFLYLIFKFIFLLEIFLGFQTATFIVRSWLPWNVFRKISTIKVLSFIFPTKPTKKNHVWITLLRRPLHRRTSLHAGNICSMFEQPKLKSETYDSLILI